MEQNEVNETGSGLGYTSSQHIAKCLIKCLDSNGERQYIRIVTGTKPLPIHMWRISRYNNHNINSKCHKNKDY